MIEISELLVEVLEKEASDLHITAGIPPTVRVNGVLQHLDHPKLMPKETQELIYSILTQEQREQVERRKEYDMSYSLSGRSRFRVNVYFQRNSLAAAFRLIPMHIRSLSELGLPPALEQVAKKPRGFVVITGPTGSGKSTTLAALVDQINSSKAVHIMTVEDPIEYLHRHKKAIVNQREIGADTDSFPNALKYVLRQDPDVILIGEMRDIDTISTALTAAETGHLVFTTLHTQDAPQTINRIIDVFPPYQQQQVRMQLAGTLQCIVSQQLLPAIDGTGRVIAAELLMPTPGIRNMIREAKTHQIRNAMQTGQKYGMQTMDHALATLYRQGKISFDVALSQAADAQEVKQLLGRVG
ncbi:MAG TPA: type IV pilus twitching motility protein PilT [Actinobacteria bacterium]|nr:type IV pilus twitching motility protein PilT [Actinomycetota bacterium]